MSGVDSRDVRVGKRDVRVGNKDIRFENMDGKSGNGNVIGIEK